MPGVNFRHRAGFVKLEGACLRLLTRLGASGFKFRHSYVPWRTKIGAKASQFAELADTTAWRPVTMRRKWRDRQSQDAHVPPWVKTQACESWFVKSGSRSRFAYFKE